VWKLVFGFVGLTLALMGPIGFVRRFVRKFAIWAVGASIVYLTFWILHHANLHRMWNAGGSGGSFWAAVDLVIALTVSWIPLVADYTRFSRTRRDAFWGAGLGYLLPTLFQFGFGTILVLSHPAIDGPTAVLVTVAAGGVGSVLALLALTVDETDEAFANIYSTAVSIQNFRPRTSQRRLIVGVAALATLISLAVDLRQYQDFLLLLGAFFVPLFGVLLADWLVAGRHYSEADVFSGPAWRPGMIGAWLAGFALYQYLAPAGPHWWKTLIHHSAAPFDVTASMPSFALAFALAGIASLAWRRAGMLAPSQR
jgi:purine-cytosine permease-like protein